ncbi:MAG: phospholipase D-like domain-containing protein [Bacteroidota bacterium]
MPLTIGNFELHMGPKQLGAPDDLKQPIIDFIDKAEKRLDVAVQELDSWDIAKALIRARQERKVTLRVVLESDYLRSSKCRTDPFVQGGKYEINRQICDALLRANINLKTDYNTSIFHQKFMVRDSEAVLTGSTNFTDRGTAHNLNHIVVIEDKDVAKIYGREFREIMQGRFGKLNEGHDPRPPEVTISGVPMKILFAPDHSPEMEIMKQMEKSRRKVDFAIFTFSKSSGIDDTIVLLEKAGIPVRGVFDGMSANQDWAATKMVAEAGAEAHVTRKGSNGFNRENKLGKLHHKLMIIDDRVIVIGSFNYTGPANALNDENIMIIGDLKSTDAESIANQEKIGQYALKEVDRIIEEFSSKVEVVPELV